MPALSSEIAYATATLLTEATDGAYVRKSSCPGLIYAEIRRWLQLHPISENQHRVWWNNIYPEAREVLEGNHA
jgi:hypothetical protein